jgi:hypothetical protein
MDHWRIKAEPPRDGAASGGHRQGANRPAGGVDALRLPADDADARVGAKSCELPREPSLDILVARIDPGDGFEIPLEYLAQAGVERGGDTAIALPPQQDVRKIDVDRERHGRAVIDDHGLERGFREGRQKRAERALERRRRVVNRDQNGKLHGAYRPIGARDRIGWFGDQATGSVDVVARADPLDAVHFYVTVTRPVAAADGTQSSTNLIMRKKRMAG